MDRKSPIQSVQTRTLTVTTCDGSWSTFSDYNYVMCFMMSVKGHVAIVSQKLKVKLVSHQIYWWVCLIVNVRIILLQTCCTTEYYSIIGRYEGYVHRYICSESGSSRQTACEAISISIFIQLTALCWIPPGHNKIRFQLDLLGELLWFSFPSSLIFNSLSFSLYFHKLD